MNDQLEKMWKEAVIAWFKTLAKRLVGRIEENHEKLT
jgi:hypothetical protein